MGSPIPQKSGQISPAWAPTMRTRRRRFSFGLPGCRRIPLFTNTECYPQEPQGRESQRKTKFDRTVEGLHFHEVTLELSEGKRRPARSVTPRIRSLRAG